MQDETIKINFTKRYILALMLIALLSTGTYYILIFALKTSDSTALIVNKSAKQRMYSQRIASFSQQYYNCTYLKEHCSQQATIQLTLEEAINEMRQSNNALSSGNLNKEVQINLSSAMADIYFGDMNLKKRVDNYLDFAKHLMKSQTQEEALDILDHLLLLSNPLLVDLNGAVLQYQKEGEENIANIRHLESLAWIVTLFTLLMEVIFIFQPMANAIKLFIQNERSHNERLEQEIKIRTYSLEQANQKLSYSASHDPLTGLYNRVKVEETFLYEQKQSIRHGDPLSIILMDLDFFKSVNDVYGHNAGDIFLQEVAEILRDTFRSTDVIGRWGGEEFLIVLPKTDLTSAYELAIKLRDRMQETKFTNIGTRTSSCGVATLLEDESLVNVIQRADSALYLAKDNGRNRVEVANS